MVSTSKFVVLNSGTRLRYASEDLVRDKIKEKRFSGMASVSSTDFSDLNSGIYEGGLKIWEGAVDLCNFIDANFSSEHLKGKRVLELGCGAALPTIFSILKGASFAVVNDFNEFVLECFSAENFILNGVFDTKYKRIAGSWSSLASRISVNNDENGQKVIDLKAKSFDLIFTSETIYNPKYYHDLHNLLNLLLADDGEVLLAAKVYYFGLDASVDDFQKFADAQQVFNFEDAWTSDGEGIPRKILRFTRRPQTAERKNFKLTANFAEYF